MILIGGENLIDFIQHDTANGLPSYQANPGGAPFNCAKAIARQGVKSGYLTPISNDTLGDLLADDLVTSGAEILTPRSPAPTSLAVVSLQNGQAQYQFYRENTAERLVTLNGLVDATPQDAKAIYLGSLAITDGDDADIWTDYYLKLKSNGVFTALDPNIRAPFIKDRAAFLARLELLLQHTDLLKLSDEDLNWLSPDTPLEEAAKSLMARSSAKLMVVTAGGDGAFAMAENLFVRVSAANVREMRDTVGAGDTFMATLLAHLQQSDQLGADHLAQMGKDALTILLTRAATAAALNCEKTGCQPPTLTELNARLGG